MRKQQAAKAEVAGIACSIGLAVAAWLGAAQGLPAQAAQPLHPGAGASGQSDGRATLTDEDAGRLTVIRVELAWLADPVTSGCDLEAEMTDNRLEVWGHVPNAAVRNRALQLARLHGRPAVIDFLKEGSRGDAASRTVPIPELHVAVCAAIKSAFPTQAPLLKCQCRPGGQVVVMGYVASYEEKLAVSQALRRVSGCRCVVNIVHVDPGDVPAPRTSAIVPVATPPTTDTNPWPEDLPLSSPANPGSPADIAPSSEGASPARAPLPSAPPASPPPAEAATAPLSANPPPPNPPPNPPPPNPPPASAAPASAPPASPAPASASSASMSPRNVPASLPLWNPPPSVSPLLPNAPPMSAPPSPGFMVDAGVWNRESASWPAESPQPVPTPHVLRGRPNGQIARPPATLPPIPRSPWDATGPPSDGSPADAGPRQVDRPVPWRPLP